MTPMLHMSTAGEYACTCHLSRITSQQSITQQCDVTVHCCAHSASGTGQECCLFYAPHAATVPSALHDFPTHETVMSSVLMSFGVCAKICAGAWLNIHPCRVCSVWQPECRCSQQIFWLLTGHMWLTWLPSLMPRISGATYCGEPHMVDSTVPGAKNLDRPKSAILMDALSVLSVMSMFSSFKSLCTMPAQSSSPLNYSTVCVTVHHLCCPSGYS